MVFKGATQKVSKVLLGETSAKKRGLLPTAVIGAGAEAAMRMIDNIVGGPIQRIFSVNAPFVGTLGPIDFINFMIFSNGAKNIRQGITAVVGAKIILGGGLSGIALPALGSAGINLSQQSSTASGQSGGPT